MSYISFNGKPNPYDTPKQEKSCTATTVSYSIMVNGSRSLNPLYYYEQDDIVPVHIAVPTRRTLVTDTDTVYNSFTGKLAYGIS